MSYNPAEIKVLITAKNDHLLVEPISNDQVEKYSSSMVRHFQKSGQSGYALYFTSSLIEYLEIEPDIDFLDITIDENIMRIKKAQ